MSYATSTWIAPVVLATVRAERKEGLKPAEFTVKECINDGPFTRIVVESTRKSRALDERLEGSRAWWPGPTSGTADVLQVDAEQSAIVLRFMSQPAPTGGTIRLYQPDFLGSLEEFWADPVASARALGALAEPDGPSGLGPADYGDCLRSLRARQVDAVALAGRRRALLHGPPGTGKTHTLVTMLAGLLRGKCGRILFVAPTHTAVDELVLRLDSLLYELGDQSARQSVKRWGTGVAMRRYHGRDHLLPVKDEAKLEEIAILEVSEPPREDVAAWARWRDMLAAKRRALQMDLRAVSAGCRLLAMTTTAAIYNWRQLADCRWDLLLADEASQIVGAAAVMCASLAGAVIFAGDPKQLAAPVRSDYLGARHYLEATAFDIFSGSASIVELNEQSRMVMGVCQVVSRVFYSDKLVVAEDKTFDEKWLSERAPFYFDGARQAAAQVLWINGDGCWSTKYGGPIRYLSAVAIADVVDELTGAGADRKSILVLTPYRAQRALLRAMLRNRRHLDVEVSTVHRAQGNERLVVLFDPVDGAGAFLKGESGDRLINVAISRAMAHVFVCLSHNDLSNRTLRRIAHICGATGSAYLWEEDETPADRREDRLPSVVDFASREEFPRCLQSQVLRAGLCQGRVVEVIGRKIVIQDEEEGARTTLSIDHILRRANVAT